MNPTQCLDYVNIISRCGTSQQAILGGKSEDKIQPPESGIDNAVDTVSNKRVEDLAASARADALSMTSEGTVERRKK